jgi:hypothetical protein
MTEQSERDAIINWLRWDADLTEAEARIALPNTDGLTPRDIGDWGRLISMKRGIANAIERGDHMRILEQPE